MVAAVACLLTTEGNYQLSRPQSPCFLHALTVMRVGCSLKNKRVSMLVLIDLPSQGKG